MDKRKFNRIKINLAVTYRNNALLDVRVQKGRQEREAIMEDMSEGGIAIVTDVSVPAGLMLTIKFSLADTKSKDAGAHGIALLTGKVLYAVPAPAGRFRVGIEFQELNKQNREKLRTFIEATDKR